MDALKIIPDQFRNEYITNADGSTSTREWVLLTKPGVMHSYATWYRITDQFKARSALWPAIQPAYDAWKRGQDAPETGTPLGAWPAINQEIAAAFRAVGVRSVEEVADIGESVMAKVRIPNVRRWKDEAKLFLKARDSRGIELTVKAQNEEIAALKAQIAELAAVQNEEAPRRRGRPPKVRDDEPEAEEQDEAA